MSSEVFRRVGRGGAGNWYSQKEVNDAEKTLRADIEAQKKAAADAAGQPDSASATAQQSVPVYVRGGRGGAGNVAPAAAEALQERDEAEKTRAVVAATPKPRTGLSGRGGMGNWRDSTAPQQQSQPQDQKKVEDLELQVLQDVEAGLPPPPRTYHQHDREMET
ncbi:hypothetical protein B0T26DRAFT_641380 [Lasiosphaeria miniovina]|uniref:Uncharacterized protein n=1 Tax=Lasiosphaeria miniovina TaxID=1954250 RepID=A0AA40AVW5_9PEZI|nr:uncharacterized protein B0T26DRAFT_641380 [Lasiosphaeria miniovina]KAK0722934.1 hypothetical protein B0T26DRAFT_641380 [Lasiosphaeria miniovina]